MKEEVRAKDRKKGGGQEGRRAGGMEGRRKQ